MIVFKDRLLDVDVCSDAFRFTLDYDGQVMCFKGQLCQKQESGDYDIGANPSQEEATESLEANVESGIDICLNHNLEDGTAELPKSTFKKYIGKYCKKVRDKLDKDSATTEDDIKQFKEAAAKLVKNILEDFDSYQFFRTKLDAIEIEDPDDVYYIPVKYNEDEKNYTFFFLKGAVREEKF